MELIKTYSYLNNIVLSYINNMIEQLNDFDEERFNFWLEVNQISSKDCPSAYVKACFLKELEKGTFTKPPEPEIKYIPTTQPFFNALRENGIEIIWEDTTLIDETFRYLLNNEILSADELSKLNRNIIDYVLAQPGEHTSREFIELMTKSNTLKGRYIDWVGISNNAARQNEEWESLLEDLHNLDKKQ